VCPNRANYTYHVAPVEWILPVLACQNGELATVGQERFAVAQSRQILHLDDLCNECGNCATFCVHQGKPYVDKPRLFLSRPDFGQEHENAFHIRGNAVYRRERGDTARLAVEGEQFAFQDAQVDIRFSSRFEMIELALRAPFEGTISLQHAAEMALIWRGVTESLPFLLGARPRVQG
jgi:putative selenate reductase